MPALRRFVFSHAYMIIICLLVVISLAFLLLGVHDQHLSPLYSNLFINLAASGFFALITVLIIEYLRDAKLSLDTVDARRAANLDAVRLVNMLVWWVAGPLGESILDYRIDTTNIAVSQGEVTKAMIDQLKLKDLKRCLAKMSPEDWQHMITNLMTMREQVDEYARYYSGVSDKRVYAKYLACRRLHAGLTRVIVPGPLEDLLTKSETGWPPNKYGPEQNKAIRKSLIDGFEKDLEQYLNAVSEFYTSVSMWTKKTGFQD